MSPDTFPETSPVTSPEISVEASPETFGTTSPEGVVVGVCSPETVGVVVVPVGPSPVAKTKFMQKVDKNFDKWMRKALKSQGLLVM